MQQLILITFQTNLKSLILMTLRSYPFLQIRFSFRLWKPLGSENQILQILSEACDEKYKINLQGHFVFNKTN